MLSKIWLRIRSFFLHPPTVVIEGDIDNIGGGYALKIDPGVTVVIKGTIRCRQGDTWNPALTVSVGNNN